MLSVAEPSSRLETRLRLSIVCGLLVLLAPLQALAETRATIQTDDGATLVGAILAETKEGYLFKPDGAPTRVVPFGKIVSLQQGDGPSSAPAPSPAPPAPTAPAPAAQPPAATPPTQAPAGPQQPPTPASPASSAPPAAPARAPTPAAATNTPRATAKTPPAQPATPARPGIAFLAGVGVNTALMVKPFDYYPFLSADVLMGARFPDSTYGIVGMSTAAVGLNGFSPGLGLGIVHDQEGGGTAYGGFTHTIETGDVCMQVVFQGDEGGSWLVRGGWCADAFGSGANHVAIGIGAGFGT